MFTELASRLDRPKFDKYREPEAWNLFLSELVELVPLHENAVTANGTSRDLDDDEFLALAITAQADAIISGDANLQRSGTIEREWSV